ncbi:MAG: mannose-1-phosphate guanylyltransferase [Flavobacteriales bacterium]|nr:mannose-1-phosphate guanylyltransferase [Flavobacteriales bacterium]
MSKNYGVIMAGGIGSRFWPMSRSSFPKQFHDILGLGKSLIQMTFERLSKVCPPENILIVTNKAYFDLVKEQIPEIQDHRILLEPCKRNTAPCIAYANFNIAAECKDANIIVAPSDHLILNEDEFVKTIELAFESAENTSSLVTLGIKPSRPDTGYGYIEFEKGENNDVRSVHAVEQFREKPDAGTAKTFLEKGNFYWNSGIFVWTLKDIQNAFRKDLGGIYDLLSQGADLYNTDKEEAFVNETYPKCDDISIDYGIMEKAESVKVILSDFSWSDLGTWGSLYTHVERDENENAMIGKDILMYDSSDNMVKVSADKLVVLQGLEGYIVVETEEALLVCKKDEEQKIKQIVSDLKSGGLASYT